MSSVKVSVIVPIYKAEQFIERCVRSLMEQSMKDDIEFVFVNDCTPDQSMQILERVINDYPERNNQIVIWNNPENLGVTRSRKKGVELSNGEYIGWCDSMIGVKRICLKTCTIRHRLILWILLFAIMRKSQMKERR